MGLKKEWRRKACSLLVACTFIGTVFTLLPGNAGAVIVTVQNLQGEYTQGESIDIIGSITIEAGERIPINYVSMNIKGATTLNASFTVAGTPIYLPAGINVTMLSQYNPDYGYGYGYGYYYYDYGYLYGYDYNYGYGYDFGYGYGYLGQLTYRITIDSEILNPGNHTLQLHAQTGRILHEKFSSIVYPFYIGTGATIVPHSPIRINSNADFDWEHGVMNWATGNGTVWNPWIIEGWDINGTGYGYCIYVGNTTDYFTVRDCYLLHASGNGGMYYWDSGVALSNVHNGIIANNNASNNGDGIYLYSSGNNTLVNNTAFLNSAYGIYLGSSSDYNLIANNTVSSNWIGVILISSSNNILADNTVSNNGYGFSIAASSDYNHITNNTASSNSFIGIYLYSSCDCNILTDNNASSNGYAICLESACNYNTIANNTAFSNSRGIRLISSNNNTIVGNFASQSEYYYGIYFNDSSNNIVSNNIVSNNDRGIQLEYNCIDNVIANNTASNNWYGINIYYYSSSNTIYHNKFINNTNQAYDDGTNFWDDGYPSGGNYWSDYNGTDDYSGPGQNLSGSDGIGDTPYTNILGGTGAQDDYPLMYPWGEEPQYTPHLPIRINSNTDFVPLNGISGGNGTQASPWIIEGWDINGTEYGYCIYIGNTTDHFEVKNCFLHDASGVGSYPFYPDSGLILYNATFGKVSGNTAPSNNQEGIYLASSSNNTIANNTALNSDAGINLDSSNSNIIANNTALNNQWGICLDHSNNNTIANNTALNNQWGIALFASINNNISKNNAANNEYGILLSSSSNNTIASNNASNNDYGILLGYSNSNTVTNNIANSNNECGIYLEEASDHIIANNSVSLNTNDGFFICGPGDNNLMYHNNIISNGNQAYDEGLNLWDNGYPSGGNYWSDYNGTDIYSGPGQDIPGSDGIGDTPYTNIQGGTEAQDNYPLMNLWSPSVSEEFSIPIYLGWNLVSIPLDTTATDIQSVLASISGQYDVVKCFSSTDAADPWKTYRPGSPTNDLVNIDRTMGFWLHATAYTNLTVSGEAPVSTQITLHAGWNLVGYPTQTEQMMSTALWGTGADIVEAFDSGSPYLISEIGPTYMMKPGEGYWVHVPADTIWTIDW